MKFVPYICCGDPDEGNTFRLARILAPHSYAIELGIPFSDPIADGPTIQAASQRALKSGMNVEKAFSLASKIRGIGLKTPLVFMTYYNIVYSYGQEKFLGKMRKCGVVGLIVPDLPYGQDKTFERLAKSKGIQLICLVAPNTPSRLARQMLNSGRTNLFTYLVSAAGTTGSKSLASPGSIAFVRKLSGLSGKKQTLCVGFGISNSKQAALYKSAGADGVIIGSEIINIYSKSFGNGKNAMGKALLKISTLAKNISLV